MRWFALIVPFLLIGQTIDEDVEMILSAPDEEFEIAIGPNPQDIPIEELKPVEREKIEDIIYQSRLEHIKLRSQIEVKELELRKLLRADNPNMSKIKQIVKDIANLKADAKFRGIENHLKIRDIVGSERWEKLKQHRHRKMKIIRKRLERNQHP